MSKYKHIGLTNNGEAIYIKLTRTRKSNIRISNLFFPHEVQIWIMNTNCIIMVVYATKV